MPAHHGDWLRAFKDCESRVIAPPLPRSSPLASHPMAGFPPTIQVATFIVQKILLDEVGLAYICATAERFYAVSTVLSNMVAMLVDAPSPRLLKHIARCYLRLADNLRCAPPPSPKQTCTTPAPLPSHLGCSLCMRSLVCSGHVRHCVSASPMRCVMAPSHTCARETRRLPSGCRPWPHTSLCQLAPLGAQRQARTRSPLHLLVLDQPWVALGHRNQAWAIVTAWQRLSWLDLF